MRNLLIASTGFLAGGGLIVALLLALPQTANITARPAGAQAAALPRTSQDATTMVGSGMVASAPVAATATSRLTIQHVLKGCHVWSNGTTTATMMRLTLTPGGKLAILDQDVDVHQLIELSGPARLRVGGPMLMNHGTLVSFSKPGVYRLQTKTVEMPRGSGMNGTGMKVKTIGPDNTLRLVVTVA